MASIHARVMLLWLLLLMMLLLRAGVMPIRAPGILCRRRGRDLLVLLLGRRRAAQRDLRWRRLLL